MFRLRAASLLGLCAGLGALGCAFDTVETEPATGQASQAAKPQPAPSPTTVHGYHVEGGLAGYLAADMIITSDGRIRATAPGFTIRLTDAPFVYSIPVDPSYLAALDAAVPADFQAWAPLYGQAFPYADGFVTTLTHEAKSAVHDPGLYLPERPASWATYEAALRTTYDWAGSQMFIAYVGNGKHLEVRYHGDAELVGQDAVVLERTVPTAPRARIMSDLGTWPRLKTAYGKNGSDEPVAISYSGKTITSRSRAAEPPEFARIRAELEAIALP